MDTYGVVLPVEIRLHAERLSDAPRVIHGMYATPELRITDESGLVAVYARFGIHAGVADYVFVGLE